MIKFCPLALVLSLACLIGSTARSRAGELILDGTFVTTPALTTGTYSQQVGRTGQSGATSTLSGTTGSTGWFTTESDGLFEVWTPGVQGSPTTAGNTLELGNNTGGQTIYQNVTASPTGGTAATFSFGYADRNSGQDAFTLTITNETTSAVLYTQAFNPTGSFAVNQLFSTGLTIIPGDVYRVAFLDQNTSSDGTQSAHIDNVSFFQVPEPSTWAALAVGLSGCGALARRRRTSVRH